ncbi:MAG TPA: ribokinase [Chitinophagaceae bacterium]|jgi:ribokinase|nr:ribokinase [Chitinophagaceae bacterium]
MNQIFVIGSSNTDMVVKTAELPLPGETILGGTFFMNAGGKGANQAVAAARLGGNVTLVTKLGNDIFGKQTMEGFKKENIDTKYVFLDNNNPSGTALIIVNAEGENCIVVAPGANANLLPSDIERVKNIGEASIILMQLEIPIHTIEYVAKLAKSNHQKLIINPAPAQNLDDELLRGLFLITPNETEAFLLTGIKVVDEATASTASQVFLKKGVKNVIITLGREGAYFQNDNLKIKINAPAVKTLDTTAAGDTFNGAISVAITENMDWEKALQFSVQAASISVTRMGAQSSVPYRKELI